MGNWALWRLQDGSVAMLDIPGRATVTTFHVGGNPQFIITGLYPPAVPQNSPLSKILNIGAYILVVALIIVPLLLFRRYSKTRRQNGDDEKEEAGLLRETRNLQRALGAPYTFLAVEPVTFSYDYSRVVAAEISGILSTIRGATSAVTPK